MMLAVTIIYHSLYEFNPNVYTVKKNISIAKANTEHENSAIQPTVF